MHVFGQGASSVMEEAFAYIKKYEQDASTVEGLKYAFIKDEEQLAKYVKVNAKHLNAL